MRRPHGPLLRRELTTAEALLDQRVACGVGNVYKSEVLWACELDPFTPVGALDTEQRTKLIEIAAAMLRANLDTPTRVTSTGSPEGLAVYGRFGKPCLRCSTPIEVRKHGEQARVTYWCPTCQLYLPLPEPDPDELRRRAPSRAVGASRGAASPWRRRPGRATTRPMPAPAPADAARPPDAAGRRSRRPAPTWRALRADLPRSAAGAGVTAPARPPSRVRAMRVGDLEILPVLDGVARFPISDPFLGMPTRRGCRTASSSPVTTSWSWPSAASWCAPATASC